MRGNIDDCGPDARRNENGVDEVNGYPCELRRRLWVDEAGKWLSVRGQGISKFLFGHGLVKCERESVMTTTQRKLGKGRPFGSPNKVHRYLKI